MIDLAKLSDELKEDEGLRLKPYRCPAGKLSIGYGRNLEDVGITLDEARVLLRNDITRVLVECRAQDWWAEIEREPVRARAILNMAFNLGLPKLLGFRRMIAAIRRQDWEAAADEMLDSKWAREDVPKRAGKLARMMREG